MSPKDGGVTPISDKYFNVRSITEDEEGHFIHLNYKAKIDRINISTTIVKDLNTFLSVADRTNRQKKKKSVEL